MAAIKGHPLDWAGPGQAAKSYMQMIDKGAAVKEDSRRPPNGPRCLPEPM